MSSSTQKCLVPTTSSYLMQDDSTT
uniref:Uncharacterized protein n=1 Tax=Arundo donax TaxID=35708 RepID=A0A0A9C399_ARUDO